MFFYTQTHDMASSVVTKYYFVVYLTEIRKNCILPSSWIKDVDQHYEKFMNNSINSNQVFDCYFTVNPNAFDENGCPKHDFVAKFGLPPYVLGGNADEGCFAGKIKKVKSRYLDFPF